MGMEKDEERGEFAEEWKAALPGGRPDSAIAPTWQEVKVWALVLIARSIPSRLDNNEQAPTLLVPVSHLIEAKEELRLFEEENRDWPPKEPPHRPLARNTLSTLSIILLIATFHNITLLDITSYGGKPVDWVEAGSANAALIQAGQWWRLVTALTLHSDSAHLLSNLTIGGVFIYFLCRDLGSGLSWSLILGAGVLGNLVNAWVHPPGHISVGASTAVFGAVGILAAISMVRYRHQLRRRWGLPIAAALALLALLGTEGKQTDIAAHLFGFFYGLSLGLPAEYLTGRHGLPGQTLNALLSLSTIAIVIYAWWMALLHI
jgi:membrane associated rhomboid family serine protease